MPKYYVVWAGKTPGIYSSWEDCLEQIRGFPGAKFKSFGTEKLAEVAFGIADKSETMPEEARKMAMAVDAAYSSSSGKGECRAVMLPCGKEMWRVGPWGDTTNNIMEFIAIVKGLRWIDGRGVRIPLFSDSAVAISWVSDGGVCRTKHRPPRDTVAYAQLEDAEGWLKQANPELLGLIRKWDTTQYGEIPADFGRK